MTLLIGLPETLGVTCLLGKLLTGLHDFRFYKFTMDIGNRFICNFRFHWFTCNIKNRFTSNFTFQRLTGDITNRFTGEVKLYGVTRNNTKVSCATKECTDL